VYFMRWQRHSFHGNPLSGSGAKWQRLTSPFALASCLAAGAILLSATTPAPAEAEKIVEGGAVVDVDGRPERGMPASNPRVRGLVDGNPQDFVTVCVAGCAGKPRIVQMLPKPYERRAGAMRTTAAGTPDHGSGPDDAVTCLAGCGGRPGQIVQRLPDLPPPPVAQAAPKKESWEQKLMDELP